MASWFVKIGGKRYGPLNDAQLKGYADQGEITPKTRIRRDGMAEDVLASEVKGLFPKPSAPAETPGANPVTPPPAVPVPPTFKSSPAPGETGPVAGLLDELSDYEQGAKAATNTGSQGSGFQLASSGLPTASGTSPQMSAPVNQTSNYEPYRPPSYVAESQGAKALARAEPKNFFAALPEAFLYPLKGMGSLILFGLSATLVIVPAMIPLQIYFYAYVYLQKYPPLMLGLLLVVVLVYVYFSAYVFSIGRATMDGEDSPPSLPDFGEMTDQISFPALLLGVTCLVGLLPYLTYSWSFNALDAYIALTGNVVLSLWMKFVRLHHYVLTWPVDPLGWVLRIAGLAYYPMALMAVTARGSFSGLNPQLIGRAIITTPLSCLAAMLFIGLKFSLWTGMVDWTLRQVSDLNKLFALQLNPNWLLFILVVASFLYMLMVQGRIIGLLYRCNYEKLRFIETD